MIAGISGARDNRLLAQQEPALPQRWDGLIELISGLYQWAPPTVDPPIPADGPSEMSRQAINGDGRYILLNATAPKHGYSTTALYNRDRRTGETRVQLGGPALQAVISADGDHLAYKVCDPWMRQDQLPMTLRRSQILPHRRVRCCFEPFLCLLVLEPAVGCSEAALTPQEGSAAEERKEFAAQSRRTRSCGLCVSTH